MALRLATTIAGITLCVSIVHAAGTSVEKAAQRLVAATVTVRSVAASADTAGQGERDARRSDGDEVTVSSGVSLGKGLIVTFRAMPEADAEMPRFRITLPAGDQAEAELRVIDRHSGLVLLEIENRDLPGLEFAAQLPKVAGSVLTAAAAGIEEPAVSAGILGAIDRSLAGVDLPPMLQCDLRTTETSSGAAVVDADGNLLGIVAATAQVAANSGWTYALPARHVQRMVAAKQDGKVIELLRRRPVVGFTIGAGPKEGTVLVERVEKSGPADAAGIQPGDQVIETDGLKIRSAYQAIALILKKQPGDRVSFTVERKGRPLKFNVLLDGGAMPIAEISPKGAGVKVGPGLKAMRAGGGPITIRDNNSLSEVAVDPNSGVARRSVGNEAELLRLQLGAYERVIERMQQEIESLRRETKELREQAKEGK